MTGWADLDYPTEPYPGAWDVPVVDHPLAGTPGDPARLVDIDDDQDYAMSGLEAAHQRAAADEAEQSAVTISYAVQPTLTCDHVVVIRDSEKDWWRCSSCGQVEQCHDAGPGFDCEGGPHNSSDGNRRCSDHEALR